jgi:protein ImuA
MPPSFDPLARPEAPLPQPETGLEEAAAADPRDWAQTFAFGLSRLMADDDRPILLALARDFRRERGEPFARGLAQLGVEVSKVLVVRAEREAEALWAMEEALKSGAVCGALAGAEQPAFVATRRLDFAARAGRATGLLLRTRGAGDLSAARLRWQVSARPSAPHPFDPRAPGALRLNAALVRRRNGPLGAWELEQDHETHRLRLAAGLAGDGLVQDARTSAAA